MENIQAEEETRPLAQPQRRVAQAYAEINDGSRSILKKSSFWILCVVAFLVFSYAGGDGDNRTIKKKKREKRLRNKAEVAPAEVVQKQSEINRKIDLNEKYEQLEVTAPGAYGAGKFNDNERVPSYDDEDSEDNEEELDEEIDTVMADVDEAEEEEIEINDSMLVSAVRNMEGNVKFYFGRVFGKADDASSDFIDDLNESEDETFEYLSDEQLDIIAKKIADRLESDVKKDFRAKADVIAEEKVEEIDQVINEDRNSDMDANKIKEDVAEAEKVVVEDLRDEIDKAAVKVKDSIPDKVKRIRNEVMEEETGMNMDYIERKKKERREKMLIRAEKRHEEQLQKRKEFDEANGMLMDTEKSKYKNEDAGGKSYQASKKVMPVASDDEAEPRQQKKPRDYSNSDDVSEKNYQTTMKKEKVYKEDKYVRGEKKYYEDESSE